MDLLRVFELQFIEGAVEEVIGGAVVLLFTVVFAWARRFLRQRPFHKIWDPVVADAQDIHIVYADMVLPEFEIGGTSEKSHLPLNVPLLPAQEAVGISDVYRALHHNYGKRRIHLHSARDFRQYNETVVCIGGPSVNKATKEFLSNRRLDSKFRMIYPQHRAEDDADGEQYTCEERDEEITSDYGFIFIAPNPLAKAHTICALFGIWPQGSRAAAQMLVDPARSDPRFKDFVSRVKDRSGVLGIVKTEVHGLEIGDPWFVKVRDLA
jgi:hypothetical protein